MSDFDPSAQAEKDEFWMQEALNLAAQAELNSEVPVGAVVVYQNQVIGRGFNRNILDADPTAHAEIVAMREAGRARHNHRLGGCAMFVTIEPCAMCAGALVHARFSRLVYAADDKKAGAVHSMMQVLNHPGVNHQMEVKAGVLGEKCAQIIQDFFRRKRAAGARS